MSGTTIQGLYTFDEDGNPMVQIETSPGKLRIEDMLDLHKELWEHCSAIEGILELEAMLDFIGENSGVEQTPEWDDQVSTLVHKATRGVYNADLCFVSENILRIAVRASEQLPLPISLSKQETLGQHGLFLFERTVEFESENEEGESFPVDGILWTYDPDILWKLNHNASRGEGFHLWLVWGLREEGEIPPRVLRLVHWYPFELDAPIQFDEKRGSVAPAVKLFISLMLLSRQTLADTSTTLAPRSARRRTGAWRPDNGYVSVITLRKISRPGKGAEKMDFQYRFLVGEHWRRQWYPSLQKHQWKFIHTYVKGPEDKPLVVRSRRTFNFRR